MWWRRTKCGGRLRLLPPPLSPLVRRHQGPALPADHRRSDMRAVLQERPDVDVHGLRSPARADIEALGQLMYRAYLGTIDYEGETPEQSVEEIHGTHRGDYGPFDPVHSSVAERAGRLVSATLITRWQGRPFVAFTMTDPGSARQGLARATLERSMRLLHQDGERELRLAVTLENEPARTLYETMSFGLERHANHEGSDHR